MSDYLDVDENDSEGLNPIIITKPGINNRNAEFATTAATKPHQSSLNATDLSTCTYIRDTYTLHSMRDQFYIFFIFFGD